MQPFELKGRTAALTVLQLATSNLDAITAGLAARTESSPGYFKNSLCLIDLDGLTALQTLQIRRGGYLQPAALDVTALVAALRGFGIVPVLLKGGDTAQQTAAIGCGLGLVQEAPPSGRSATPEPAAPETSAPEEQPAAAQAEGSAPAADVVAASQDASGKEMPGEDVAPPTCTVVRRQVRSGQRIYARGGDLVVFGAVNPGAEVIADGSIHVYGALRGRAMAGAQGNEHGRIFCLRLHAELIAVAGVYRTSETIEPALTGRQVQAFLQADQLVIEPIEPIEAKTVA